MTQLDFTQVATRYNTSHARLIVLDYDGTFVPYENDEHPALLPEVAAEALNILSRDRRNTVMLLSGRDRQILDSEFRNVQFVTVAEHGAFYRNPGNPWHSFYPKPIWLNKVTLALRTLCWHYKESRLAVRLHSVGWNYEAIQNTIGKEDLEQIHTSIRALPEAGKFKLYDDGKNIELRMPGVDKGSFVARWTQGRTYDFVLAVGGGNDEDIFRVLSTEAISVRVGEVAESAAKYYVKDQSAVIPMLVDLNKVHRAFGRAMKWIGLSD